MRTTLRLNDQQLAVLDRARHDAGGARSIAELAAIAVRHDRDRPADPRRRHHRPAGRPPSPHGAGAVLDEIVEAGTGRGMLLGAGDVLRVEQVVDGQCADVNAFAADGSGRRFDAARTRAAHGLRVSTGAVLWSTPPEIALLRLEADSAGPHDLCFPACSEQEFAQLTGIPGHSNCVDLQRETQRTWGLADDAVHDPLNLWLPSDALPDGRLCYWPVSCRRGDFVELRALTEVLVTVNPCASDLFGSSLYELGPVRVIVRSSGGGPPRQPPGPPPRWRWRDMALRDVAVELPAELGAHVERVRAGGWLGDSEADVVRALLLRWWETAVAGVGDAAR